MKRALFGLTAIAGLSVGIAAAQLGGMGGTGGLAAQAWKDKEPPWLIRINVMQSDEGRTEVIPEQFTVGVGDWVEFYAAAPVPPNNHERPYKVEVEIQGEALEKIAAVRPAVFFAGNFRPNPNTSIMMPYTASGPVREESQRHFFLRGKSAGKVTIKTTVARGSTWKELRQFEVTVAEERATPQSATPRQPEQPPGFQ